MSTWQVVALTVVGLPIPVLWIGSVILVSIDEHRARRRARAACPCCGGLPVALVEAAPNRFAENGVPAQPLCPAHTTRWTRIRRLERELMDGDQ